MTNETRRGARFSELLSKELKGAITANGYTVKEVCRAIDLNPSTFSNYVNGSRMLPSDVYADACEFIKVEPAILVDRAYDRLEAEIPLTLAAKSTPYDVRAQIEAEQEEP
ncbi:helix-turn-helix domain-containing protein [Mobiluncus porci]|uniref:Helix-turn-helix transcriptional regulator n=1 Tax=Mobiluncus porci TaxID=2652278 RepID=A0A7K0K578_9ACTO|nr:helix-turn-helix transcriptional regulator [Mobiluncus porci]MST50596.1 helix-turn-helix transcriptional regulator [Mobiluncus porci]